MSNPLLSHALDVSILPRGISNHAPILLKLITNSVSGPCLWRLSCFWVSDETVTPLMTSELVEFWLHNRGTASSAMVWDAFKAHTRGQYQFIIGKVGRESSQALEEAEAKEAQYVYTRTHTDLQVLQTYRCYTKKWRSPIPPPLGNSSYLSVRGVLSRGRGRVDFWPGLLESAPVPLT